MMTIKVITTEDGSKSLFLPQMNETYHSKYGAWTESEHVFIKAGYQHINLPEIKILEIGFGTGLNVLLTWLQQLQDGKSIYFETLEKHPLKAEVTDQINAFSSLEVQQKFQAIHRAKWQQKVSLSEDFVLFKNQTDLTAYQTDTHFDLIYFDAFAPDKQPEMWTTAIFEKMYNCLSKGGVLVTYSAKGSVRRTMQAAGFRVERLPGPPHKREMLRAVKE